MKDDRIAGLRAKAAALPAEPGVYIMKDREERVLYVGKARKLCNRVSSYFVGSHNRKTERMVSHVADFDTVLCATEIEALTLENVLIKKHDPPYNIKLKDAKSYPYIKVTGEAYPRVVVTRDRRDPTGSYFGPYTGVGDAYAAADAVNRAFRLPVCRREFPRDTGKTRPCLYAQMGRCMALCKTLPSPAEYAETVRRVKRVLSGKIAGTVAALEEQMHAAAEEERFEEAARLRDTAAALTRLKQKQHAVSDPDLSCDVVAVYEAASGGGVLSILSIREGALNSKQDHLFTDGELSDAEAVFTFLGALYAGVQLPPELLLAFPAEQEECEELAAALTALAGHRVTVRVPQRGEKKRLCEMALANARHRRERYESDRERSDQTAVRLAELLSLEVVPERIEAYDISEWGQELITASMVVFEGGRKKPSAYRLFRIRREGQDDCRAMKEALARRLSHKEESFGVLPDLILADGGVGQVRAVQEALFEAGCEIPVCGMVKDDAHKTRALTDGDREIGIGADPLLYGFIYKIQEEVHRFAVKSVQKAKRKTLRRSVLEDIPGIGAVKAKHLLSHFKSLREMEKAEPEELMAIPGIRETDALQIRRFFEERRSKKEARKQP